MICSSEVDLGPSVTVEVVSSEAQLLEAVCELFERLDPAVVLGYDLVKGSLGLLLSRQPLLAPRLARAHGGLRPTGLSEAPVLASQAIPGSPEDRPRKLYPPEQVSGGLELPGRLLLNVWRVLRGEAKLPSSSLHTAAHALRGEVDKL